MWGEQKKHNPILGVGEADRLVLPSPVLVRTIIIIIIIIIIRVYNNENSCELDN